MRTCPHCDASPGFWSVMRRVHLCPACGGKSKISDDRLLMSALLPMAPVWVGAYYAWRYFGWIGVILDVALAFVILAFVLQRIPLEPLERSKTAKSPEEW
jgi:hypothetical protein